MKVIWTDKAKSHVRDIYNFYSKKVSVSLAKRISLRITQKPKILTKQPQIGQKETLLREINPELRYLVEGNYKIIYLLTNTEIVIVSVFDTRQEPNKIKNF
ncbi:type II toxin-antitoxin system RelE/ParE family toxin [Roseivirga pacifica]|uniref:type II toxin-antitoxin system RelE/ParE family toxin n=1 Tax=Roseivirga pacifica TaxID=1267423 RepID=UPI003BB21521